MLETTHRTQQLLGFTESNKNGRAVRDAAVKGRAFILKKIVDGEVS